MQDIPARQVVDILPAAAQETQVLGALDRTADEGIDRPHVSPSPPPNPPPRAGEGGVAE